jgi:hypothetical protein
MEVYFLKKTKRNSIKHDEPSNTFFAQLSSAEGTEFHELASITEVLTK